MSKVIKITEKEFLWIQAVIESTEASLGICQDNEEKDAHAIETMKGVLAIDSIIKRNNLFVK